MANKNTGEQKESRRWIIVFLVQLFISTGIGIFGFDGLINLFAWYVMASFHERWKHPYFYPFTLISGVICFILFICFIMLWFINLIQSEKKHIGLYLSPICILPGCVLGYFTYIVVCAIGDWIKGFL